MTDDDNIPADHPIRKTWEANRKLGSTAGKVELARGGDKYAARQLLALFLNQINRSEDYEARGVKPLSHVPMVPSNELTRYFRQCFEEILQGKDPKAALNLSGHRRYTADDHQRLAEIGYAMATKIDEYGRGGYDRAKVETATEFLVSEGTADRAYQTYMLGKPK